MHTEGEERAHVRLVLVAGEQGDNGGIAGGTQASRALATSVSILSKARRLRNKGLTGTVRPLTRARSMQS
jgi:hypothetical protein